ncbi:MAG: DUF4827 family protein [Paludibacteraceae bacterium]|nr:DUF4827 family protein [Paludibacteraceae bacterium]
MKKIVFLLTAAAACMLIASCSQNSYSSQRKAEDRLIAQFIQRNNINVLTEEPADDYEWGENDYLLVPGVENLYFHLRERGDSTDTDGQDTITISPISTNETVVVRYKKFGLEENADTLSYWTILDQSYPMEFKYLNTASCEAMGWHYAVKYMKYTNAECQIICPSKQGFTEDQNSVTPYCYIMKIRIKR